MIPWKRIEPTVVQKIGHRTIVSKTFHMPDGKIATFETIAAEHSQCIATVALTADNKVIIARQYRPGPELIFEELPGGGVEAGEEPEAAARRELLEETGYEAGRMEHLGTLYKDAYTNTTWNFFLARECRMTNISQRLDIDEHIEVACISIEQLLENARSGRMSDVTAVFIAYEQLKSIQ